jgi:hypothetical protein
VVNDCQAGVLRDVAPSKPFCSSAATIGSPHMLPLAPRRTVFFPQRWLLGDCVHPLEEISKLLTVVHDMEGDGEPECEDIRRALLAFADELEAPLEFSRRSDGSALFEIDLGGIPLGCQHEVDASPLLCHVIEMCWDIVANATINTDWMNDWYTTHLAIIPGNGGDKLLLRTTRSPEGLTNSGSGKPGANDAAAGNPLPLCQNAGPHG